MSKKMIISGLATAVLGLVLGFIVHGLLLKGEYAAVSHLYRTVEDHKGYAPYMILAYLLIGFSLTWIYQQGFIAGTSTISQGLRFGIAIALLTTIPGYLIYYSVQPLPGMMVVKQIIFDTITMLIMGVVVAFLNRQKS